MSGKYDGGTEQRRGALYQDASLLYYLLLRLLDHPDLMFAPESIEDATFHYPSAGVTEYVQCKKIEKGSGPLYSGVTSRDL